MKVREGFAESSGREKGREDEDDGRKGGREGGRRRMRLTGEGEGRAVGKSRAFQEAH